MITALLIRGCQECREHKVLLALKDPRYVEGEKKG